MSQPEHFVWKLLLHEVQVSIRLPRIALLHPPHLESDRIGILNAKMPWNYAEREFRISHKDTAFIYKSYLECRMFMDIICEQSQMQSIRYRLCIV